MRAFILRTFAMAHKETLHALRDKQVLYLALGMPLLLVLLFGYAVTFDVDDVRVALIDHDRSPASRRLTAAIDASDAFSIVTQLEDERAVEPLLRRGRVRAVVVIPAGFGRVLSRGEQASFQLVIDGVDGTASRIALGYAQGLADAQTMRLLAVAGSPPFLPRVRTLFNPRMESALFVVPGLSAVVLAILAVLLCTLTVAREWERGSMEQLFATPVGRLSVVLGKVAPYVVLGLVQFLLVLSAGAWLFEVPFRGSALLLFGLVVLFLICVLGQGLLISMVTRNQQVATQIGAVSAILPSLLLSGFLFPIENMPYVLQLVAKVVPARYMIHALRGILLQGRGVAQLWPDFIGLALLAFAILLVSTLKFRRRLD